MPMFFDLRLGALHEPLSGRRIDPAECRRLVTARASLLQRVGIRRHDRVFIHYGNRPEFFVDLLAVWLLGACAVPLDPRLTPVAIENLARTARPRVSIWDREPEAAVREHLAKLGIALLDHEQRDDDAQPADLPAGLPWLDDDALILFTSGTTGEPKGAVHTHRSLRARWVSQREQLGVGRFARTLCVQPTNFAWSLIGNSLFPWLSGLDLYILPAFRSDVLLRLGAICDEHGITCLSSVPSMWRMVLRMAAPPRKGTLQRVTCGTGPLPATLWNEVRRWSGTDDVLNVYGISECGWIACGSSEDLEPEDGLVGRALGSVIRVLPADISRDALAHEECAPGTAGDVWVQTPALMRGYFERDDLTREVITAGWFRTGDVGMFDDRGLLHLKGRDKEMINAGGVKVYPADIDSVVARCPAVVDVCAFGTPDPLHGEQVAMAVVLHEPGERQLAELHRWMSEHLAAHQLPRSWYLLEEIPRTARGKLSRAQVAQTCVERTPFDPRTLEQPGAAHAPTHGATAR